jgi:hypothetical protein
MSAAVAIAAPSVALATHHKHHHARHHHSARTHHGVRHQRFGKSVQGQTSSAQQAGTVTSFTNGILTITLNDGSTVSGAVTTQTELECTAPQQQNQGDNDGDDNGAALTNARNDHGGGSSSGSGDDNGGGSGSGDDNGGSDDGNQMCSTASLTPGTPVAEANLEISSTGASWDKVELITASSSTSSDD